MAARMLCRRAGGQRPLLLRDGALAWQQGFASAAGDDGDRPPAVGGRGRSIVLPPPAPAQ